mmetsp:Transcript_87443/g.242552  ORF Transcript_87443/g.242552 Transcript_87443/m.242552 type:complete len:296 (-) Transcript_87443:121-1008(-)
MGNAESMESKCRKTDTLLSRWILWEAQTILLNDAWRHEPPTQVVEPSTKMVRAELWCCQGDEHVGPQCLPWWGSLLNVPTGGDVDRRYWWQMARLAAFFDRKEVNDCIKGCVLPPATPAFEGKTEDRIQDDVHFPFCRLTPFLHNRNRQLPELDGEPPVELVRGYDRRHLWIHNPRLVSEVMQVPGSHETITPIVPRPTNDEDPWVALARVLLGQRGCHTKPSELHQLVNGETTFWRHQVDIHLDGPLLIQKAGCRYVNTSSSCFHWRLLSRWWGPAAWLRGYTAKEGLRKAPNY